MELSAPGRVIYGTGAIAELGDLLANRRVLIVTGRQSGRASGATGKLTALLSAAGAEADLFEDVPPEPHVAHVEAARQAARDHGADAVIAMGGGSVLDVGKAAAALFNAGSMAMDYFDGAGIEREGIFFCAVPTTAGTGSEATPNSVLVCPERRTKKSIRAAHMMPDVAVLDPELLVSCPPRVTAQAGMDALVQGIEALFSRHADSITGALAASGVRLLVRSLETAFRQGDDINARADTLYGAYLVGVSFANARLGAVHGLAHPVGVLTGTPHGLVCARLIRPVLMRNREACPGTYTRLTELCSEDPLVKLDALLAVLEIEPCFDVDLAHDEAGMVLDYAASAGSMRANPVDFGPETLLAILKDAGIRTAS